jgi:Leucine-rich repeat (LRR) protein
VDATPTPKPKPKPKPAEKKSAIPAPAAATPAPEPAPATPAPMVVASLPAPAATPAPAAPPAPPPEPANWLATTSEQMQAAYQREVRAPFESAVAKIRQQYVAVIDASIAAATTAGKRDIVLALRAERQRVASGQPMADDGKPPAIPELKPLRDNWRGQFAKLDKDRFERAKALLARYEPALAQRETQLNAEQKLEDLAALKARRAELAATWLVPPAGQPAPAAAPAAPLKGRLAPLPLIRSLLEMHARVWVRNAPGSDRYELKTPADLKTEKFEWDEVEFRARAAGGAPISDGDLAILEQLSDLPGLALNGIPITDATVERLRTLRHLHRLRLENLQRITGKSFELIAALPELTNLALINVPVGDDTIATLAPLTKLTKLRLNDLPITDAALRIAAAMPALEDLEFGGGKVRVTSAAWECIPRMHKLVRLYPKGSALDGVVTGHIARCTGLTRLSFQDQPITDAALAPLSALSRLTSLNLGGTKVSGSAFKSWPVRNSLTTLYLDYCPGLDDSVLRAIATAFPKLETLEIGGAAGSINRAGVTELLRLRQLNTLKVQGDAATDTVATELARLETLTQLDLDKAALTEAGLNALAKLPKLRKLSLVNPPITDGALRAFKKYRTLKEIYVSPATPEAIFTRLRTDLPGVSIKR